MKSLEALFEAMKNNDPRTIGPDGGWSADLPTFGGPEPKDTAGIWSWDLGRLLVGSSLDDLRIVSREEWDEEV